MEDQIKYSWTKRACPWILHYRYILEKGGKEKKKGKVNVGNGKSEPSNVEAK